MNYWVERSAKTQAALTNKSIKETEKQLKKYYGKSMEKILEQFEKVYYKILEQQEKGQAVTPALLYRMDSYWQLQAQLRQELQKLGDKQAALMSKKFEDQYINIYNALALQDSVMFSEVDRETAHQMINQIWCADGQSWSNRIWTNTNKLQQALNDNLIDCVLTGKKTTQLKQILQEQFAVSYNRADSIVRTEMAHIQTQAAQQRYKDYGIKEVEVWVDEDERTCSICVKHEGERHSINEQMPVPFHPRCRCCIIPVVE